MMMEDGEVDSENKEEDCRSYTQQQSSVVAGDDNKKYNKKDHYTLKFMTT